MHNSDYSSRMYREAVQTMRDYVDVTKDNITEEELAAILSMFKDGVIRIDSSISLMSGRTLTGKQALEILGVSDISFGTTSHYNQYDGFEVIDVCEQLRSPDGSGNFNRGNAFKYLARAGWKDSKKEVQDLEKALNYIQREIDRVKARG